MIKVPPSIKKINNFFSFFGLEMKRKSNTYYDLKIYNDISRPIIPKYVNIGAGLFYHPYWHNLDTPNLFYKTNKKQKNYISYDLNSKLNFPFSKDSVSVFYISHVIEHLRDDVVEVLFKNVYNSLRENGVFRITCPDMNIIYDAFRRNDTNFFPTPSPWNTSHHLLISRFLEYIATPLVNKSNSKVDIDNLEFILMSLESSKAFDYITSLLPKDEDVYLNAENHINWFTEEKILRMLSKAGFKKIYSSRKWQSKKDILRNKYLFDCTVPEMSLYIECEK
jgi:predicted SAM-dependent methyltransferase